MIFKVVTWAFTLALYFMGRKGKPAYPEAGKNVLNDVVMVLTLTFTTFGIAAFPAALPFSAYHMGICLVVLGWSAPLLGLLEEVATRKTRPAGTTAFNVSRFAGHFVSNTAGAVVGGLLLVLAQASLDRRVAEATFTADFVFNIFLPLSSLIVISFVRGQQLQRVPNLDKDVLSDRAAAELAYYEDSLRRWHQIANTVFLVVVVYTCTTTLLYLLSNTMQRAKSGDPLSLTWETAVAVAIGILFILICGLPGVRKDRSVFMTFLTGGPAVLCASTLWLAMFRAEPFRDTVAFVTILAGYAAYAILVILEARDRKERNPHYYTVLAVAIIIATLLAALYANPALP